MEAATHAGEPFNLTLRVLLIVDRLPLYLEIKSHGKESLKQNRAFERIMIQREAAGDPVGPFVNDRSDSQHLESKTNCMLE